MYQLITDIEDIAPSLMVKRLADNAFIPFDPDNSDYQEYLEWVAAGNTPEPAEDA